MPVFRRVRPLRVPWQEGDERQGSDLLLSQDAWERLELLAERVLGPADSRDEDSAKKQRVAVTVCTSDLHSRNAKPSVKRHGQGLTTLVCWAGLDGRGQASEAAPMLTVSPDVITLYSHIFRRSAFHRARSSPDVLITPTTPITLTTAFLRALSPSAHAVSHSQPDLVLASLSSACPIIRQGSIIGFSLSANTSENGASNGHSVPELPDGDEDVAFRYAYRVLMCEPVLQGVLVADTTRLYILPPSESMDTESEEEDDTPTQSTVGRARTPMSEHSSDDDEDIAGLEDDAPEIDSSFLANSLPPLPSSSSSLSRQAVDTSPSHRSSVEFSPLPLPFEPRTASSPDDIVDTENCIFVRTAELAKVGVFDGDWAIVDRVGGGCPQLARAYGADDRIPTVASPQLYATSTFLHALSQPFHLPRSSANVTLTPTPFLSYPPPLPTAQAVTLARIASPASTSKSFQPLFLRALRQYFERGKRLVRMGALIGVCVCERDRALLREGDDGELMDDLLDYDFPLSSHMPDTAIFFRITNITYDPPPAGASTNGNGAPIKDDTYAAATLGELGCWFDPARTRMVQAGVEHGTVPDLGLDNVGSLFSGSSDGGSPFVKLLRLTAACLSPSALDYNLQLSVLLRGARGVGKWTAVKEVARQLGMHVLEVNCYEVVGESDAKTEGTLRARFENAAACSPCILVLRHLDALARTSQALEQGKDPSIATVLRDCIADLEEPWRTSGFPVVVVATSAEANKIPLGVQACFKHDVSFEAPDEMERLGILQGLLEEDEVAPDVSLRDVAAQSAALVAKDLVDLVSRARMAALERATMEGEAIGVTQHAILDAGLALTAADFTSALGESRASYSESIGAPKIPNVSWDDVGGLAEVKSDILDTIQLPLEHPELFADGLKKRSGILLYGPPGTGKTLLAKAVATSCSLNFFSVKGPELLNMYIGESEANVRRVFQRARDARPCVIFFDELDSVAPKRGNHGDSGGVMDRIVSQLLAELDGMSDGKSSADVFVIGATNRPDLLDPALLRPGRFDRMLYLGVSTSHDAQLKILQALTRRFRLDPELDLMRVAEQCPFNYTGADFYALCSDAMLKAMTRKAEEIDLRIAELNAMPPPYHHPHPMTPQYYLAELATDAETDVLVSQRDFEAALAELVPSVTQSEMEDYATVQRRFSKDTINSEANLDRKGKGKGKARAVESSPRSPTFGHEVMMASELDM